jgi:hypothetical protein
MMRERPKGLGDKGALKDGLGSAVVCKPKLQRVPPPHSCARVRRSRRRTLTRVECMTDTIQLQERNEHELIHLQYRQHRLAIGETLHAPIRIRRNYWLQDVIVSCKRPLGLVQTQGGGISYRVSVRTDRIVSEDGTVDGEGVGHSERCDLVQVDRRRSGVNVDDGGLASVQGEAGLSVLEVCMYEGCGMRDKKKEGGPAGRTSITRRHRRECCCCCERRGRWPNSAMRTGHGKSD